jgi:hypothetical protein
MVSLLLFVLVSVVFSRDEIRARQNAFKVEREDEIAAVAAMPHAYKSLTEAMMQSEGYRGLVFLVATTSLFLDLNELGSVPCDMGLSIRAIELFPKARIIDGE